MNRRETHELIRDGDADDLRRALLELVSLNYTLSTAVLELAGYLRLRDGDEPLMTSSRTVLGEFIELESEVKQVTTDTPETMKYDEQTRHDELDFLRQLEQSLQHLHERVYNGYSGVPEVLTLKREVNDRIDKLLTVLVASQAAEEE